MSDNERIVKIDNNKLYLTTDFCIEFSQTNFPSKEYFKFSSSVVRFWKVSVSYIKELKILKFKVIDYNSRDKDSFLKQYLKGAVSKVIFEKLNWVSLEEQLCLYKKSEFKDLVETLSYNRTRIEEHSTYTPSSYHKSDFQPIKDFTNEQKSCEIKTEFIASIKYKDALFQEGGVLIKQFYDGNKRLIKHPLFVENSEIKSEFDYIKYYFPKAFGSKNFNVKGIMVTINNEIVCIENVISEEINQINESIIDIVRRHQILSIPQINIDRDIPQKIYTLNDVLSLLSDTESSINNFISSEEQIIDILVLDKINLKNKKQLSFLSGSIHENQAKIRFTLKPKFGFIFTFTGKEKTHFCWELLESHATYIWSIKSSINMIEQYTEIEKSINYIFKYGRQKYRQAYKQGLINDEIEFQRISHTVSEKHEKDRFLHWKARLISIIK